MSNTKHIVIIGGGLAGLSAGCYARASGFETTILEHGALGGVCTAWSRGPYTVDGCIHWLTGGPFERFYRELGILPSVSTHVLEQFLSYRDLQSGVSVSVTRDLAALGKALTELAPGDADEIARLIAGSEDFASVTPPLDAPQLRTLHDALSQLWEMRGHIKTLAHFRKPLGVWISEHISDPTLRRVFTRLAPTDAPALVLLMVLGYLGRGYLSRPDGGTARFRDALIATYQRLGGVARTGTTVSEVLVHDDRARGVVLSDGSMIDADIVISTASGPETVLQLLGGHYGAAAFRKRLQSWKMFEPVVLASFGVTTPLAGLPATQIIDGLAPFDVGGHSTKHLYIRLYNDDPSFAPPGHCVVQVMANTTYDYWAKRGTSYGDAKTRVAEMLWSQLAEQLPIASSRAMTDVATPLTFWNHARSFRGAFEGWLPSSEAMFSGVDKTLPGLADFYMAGQWVEPGGGVPTAVMSGRQVMQLVCKQAGMPFSVPIRVD
ncbi:MAG TPA: NAD(P)/FAD-dependent oxidoreductase [Polyangiales bacterium]|nr:NAD(P)/FAD-dependent oxidoreductase [Polyangiales bacterium]